MSPLLLLVIGALLGIALGVAQVPLTKRAIAGGDHNLEVAAGTMLVVAVVLITAAAAGFILLGCGMI